MFSLNNWRGLNAKTVRLPSRSPWHGDNNKKRQPPHWFGVLLHNQLQGALAPAHATHEFGITSTLGPSPVSPSQAEAAISSSTAGLSRTEWEHDRQGMNLQACLSRNSLMQLKTAIPSSYLEYLYQERLKHTSNPGQKSASRDVLSPDPAKSVDDRRGSRPLKGRNHTAHAGHQLHRCSIIALILTASLHDASRP